MAKAASARVALVAAAWAKVTPRIPYVANGSTRKGADCQGLVEGCIKEAGGKADYAGSNAMFRACHKSGNIWTLTQAQKLGKLKPGALVFILENDGKEPSQYKADNLGNASHVGVYVGQSDTIWSVDASASAGKVRTRTKRDAPRVWTHAGYLPEIDYGADSKQENLPIIESVLIDEAGLAARGPYDAVVLESGAGRVRVRKSPGGEYYGHISTGQIVRVVEEVPNWCKIQWKTGTYWMMSKYLERKDQIHKLR
jgi:hypothetical protein